MTEVASVYAIFASEEEARRIGHILVAERHAACVNILGGCRSIYRWEGQVEEAEEVAGIFKTTADGAAFLIDRLAMLHSYALPAAVAWPISEAPAAYRAWVAANVGPSEDG